MYVYFDYSSMEIKPPKYNYIKVGFYAVCDSSNMRFVENGHLLHLTFMFVMCLCGASLALQMLC